MKVSNKNMKFNYLFNFSSSYSGGGLTRLIEFLNYFEEKGGAHFIVNSRLKNTFSSKYKNNLITFVKANKVLRLIKGQYFLKAIVRKHGKPELYFAYGVPVGFDVGRKNWFHLSNMFSLLPQSEYLSLKRYLEMKVLKHRIYQTRNYVNFVSGESSYSTTELATFLNKPEINSYVFLNGIPSKLISLRNKGEKTRQAISVGTQNYKRINGVVQIFDTLKDRLNLSLLHIIGPSDNIGDDIKSRPDVKITSSLEHQSLIELISDSKLYISNSSIENSSTAALEGLLLSQYTALSKIPSHLDALNQLEISKEFIEYNTNFVLVKSEIPENIITKNSWSSQIDRFVSYLSKF